MSERLRGGGGGGDTTDGTDTGDGGTTDTTPDRDSGTNITITRADLGLDDGRPTRTPTGGALTSGGGRTATETPPADGRDTDPVADTGGTDPSTGRVTSGGGETAREAPDPAAGGGETDPSRPGADTGAPDRGAERAPTGPADPVDSVDTDAIADEVAREQALRRAAERRTDRSLQTGVESGGVGNPRVTEQARALEERVVAESDRVEDRSDVAIVREGDELRAVLSRDAAVDERVAQLEERADRTVELGTTAVGTVRGAPDTEVDVSTIDGPSGPPVSAPEFVIEQELESQTGADLDDEDIQFSESGDRVMGRLSETGERAVARQTAPFAGTPVVGDVFAAGAETGVRIRQTTDPIAEAFTDATPSEEDVFGPLPDAGDVAAFRESPTGQNIEAFLTPGERPPSFPDVGPLTTGTAPAVGGGGATGAVRGAGAVARSPRVAAFVGGAAATAGGAAALGEIDRPRETVDPVAATELEVPDEQRGRTGELTVPEEPADQPSEITVPEEQTTIAPEELGVPREAIEDGTAEITGPEGTEITEDGEIVVPLGTTAVAAEERYEEEEEEEEEEDEEDEEDEEVEVGEEEEQIVIEYNPEDVFDEENVPGEEVAERPDTEAEADSEAEDAEADDEGLSLYDSLAFPGEEAADEDDATGEGADPFGEGVGQQQQDAFADDEEATTTETEREFFGESVAGGGGATLLTADVESFGTLGASPPPATDLPSIAFDTDESADEAVAEFLDTGATSDVDVGDFAGPADAEADLAAPRAAVASLQAEAAAQRVAQQTAQTTAATAAAPATVTLNAQLFGQGVSQGFGFGETSSRRRLRLPDLGFGEVEAMGEPSGGASDAIFPSGVISSDAAAEFTFAGEEPLPEEGDETAEDLFADFAASEEFEKAFTEGFVDDELEEAFDPE